MTAKQKKLMMWGIGGLGALMLFNKRKASASVVSAIGADGAPTGTGWGALTAELDNWLGQGETRQDVSGLVIPGVTVSDLEAYAAGVKYGEAAGYTEQDYLLIQQAADWG